MNEVLFLNENGVVIYNQNDIYINHLPTVGVDTTSTGSIYVVSSQSTLSAKIVDDEAGYYKIMTPTYSKKNPTQWSYSTQIISTSNNKINIEELKYLHHIRLCCSIPDGDDTFPTTSALCKLEVSSQNETISMAIITEFVEANTNQLLVNELISKNIDKYIVNACDCHACDAENPDLLMYNRKLKELLMTRTLARGTYKELNNVLRLFGFDNTKIYSTFKKVIDDKLLYLKENLPAIHNQYYSSDASMIEDYKRCYDVIIAFQMYKYGFLRGEHLTESVVPEFECDLNYFTVNPVGEDKDGNPIEYPTNMILDAQVHPMVSAFEPVETGIMTLTGQNQFTEFYDGYEEALEAGLDAASIKPRFFDDEKYVNMPTDYYDGKEPTQCEPTQVFPEVVPYIHTIDGTDTVTREEIQQKTSLIKKILNDSFSIIYNNIIFCSIEDAAYSNNIKLTSHMTQTSPNVYDDVSNYVDGYDKYVKVMLGDGLDMTLDEWLETKPKLMIREDSLDVVNRPNNRTDILYFVNEDYNYPSNCQHTNEHIIDSPYSALEYWHFHGVCADMPKLNFSGTDQTKFADFNFIEIFAIQTRYKISSDIKTNIDYCKSRGITDGYTHSLHDNVGKVSDFILLTDVGTWEITINLYNNYKELPLYTKTFSLDVINGESKPAMYRLKHINTIKELLAIEHEESIMNIHHNENFQYSYDADIDQFYSEMFDGVMKKHQEEDHQYTNNMITMQIKKKTANDVMVYSPTVDSMDGSSVVISVEYKNNIFKLKPTIWPPTGQGKTPFGFTVTLTNDIAEWEVDGVKIAGTLYDLSNYINSKVLEVKPDANVLFNIHLDSSLTAPGKDSENVDEVLRYFATIVCVKPNVKLGEPTTGGDRSEKRDEWNFFPACWKKIGLNMIKDSYSIYKKNLLDNIIYIIENSQGYFTNTNDTYSVIDQNDMKIQQINTAAMLFTKEQVDESKIKKIVCSYYNSFIEKNINFK